MGNYLTPKVMEFALSGFLRPEEDKSYDALKMKAFAANKQKMLRVPPEYGSAYAVNGNLFNVQKHLNYFQNPKN